MTITLTLPGSVKSKKNSKRPIMAGGKNKPRRLYILPSKAYLRWEKEVRQYLIRSACFPAELIDSPCSVEATFYYKGRRPDLSGACESLADCLERWVWSDDKWIESWDGSRLIHDKANPRTVVVVRW